MATKFNVYLLIKQNKSDLMSLILYLILFKTKVQFCSKSRIIIVRMYQWRAHKITCTCRFCTMVCVTERFCWKSADHQYLLSCWLLISAAISKENKFSIVLSAQFILYVQLCCSENEGSFACDKSKRYYLSVTTSNLLRPVSHQEMLWTCLRASFGQSPMYSL